MAGGAVGESVRLAAITDFTHLAEPDGSLYPHLVADALTALALVLGLGADRDTALKALTSFKPGGHRIETVAEAAVEGGSVRFVDDSKATNGHAARASLSSFPAKSVIWIAGGWPRAVDSRTWSRTRHTPSKRPSSSAKTSSR